jgi:endonuclease/exonuclease/phosphatase family metal-dependent hydrolase
MQPPSEFDAVGAAGETADRFAVATYNVHRCIGRDGRQDPVRVAGVIRELDSAFIGLQEVESLVQGDPREQQLLDIMLTTGLRAIPGPTLVRTDATFGNALLTRDQPLAIRRHDLTVLGREPRGAVDVDLVIGSQTVRVLVAHLGLRASERRWQVQRLLDLLSSGPPAPTVLLADLNEWFAWGRPLRWLDRRLGRTPARGTFPARFPVFALDRIWVSPPAHLVTVRTHRTPAALIASDHLPLAAVVALPSRMAGAG